MLQIFSQYPRQERKKVPTRNTFWFCCLPLKTSSQCQRSSKIKYLGASTTYKPTNATHIQQWGRSNIVLLEALHLFDFVSLKNLSIISEPMICKQTKSRSNYSRDLLKFWKKWDHFAQMQLLLSQPRCLGKRARRKILSISCFPIGKVRN